MCLCNSTGEMINCGNLIGICSDGLYLYKYFTTKIGTECRNEDGRLKICSSPTYYTPTKKGKLKKISVYGTETTFKPDIFLKMYQKNTHSVVVVACNRDGGIVTGGHLFSFDIKEGIYLYRHVSPRLGFARDSEGRLKVINRER